MGQTGGHVWHLSGMLLAPASRVAFQGPRAAGRVQTDQSIASGGPRSGGTQAAPRRTDAPVHRQRALTIDGREEGRPARLPLLELKGWPLLGGVANGQARQQRLACWLPSPTVWGLKSPMLNSATLGREESSLTARRLQGHAAAQSCWP